MKNLLTASQVKLGNVFLATNCKGEEVIRRVVGGTFGTVTKYFTLDTQDKLKSNARETIEEVLEGYEIKAVSVQNFVVSNYTAIDPEEIENFKRGDVLVCTVNGETVYRELVGGKQFDTTAWFAIDPVTGERKSKTTYADSNEVAEQYDIALVLRA